MVKLRGNLHQLIFISALGCDKGIASSAATRALPREARNFFKKDVDSKPFAEAFRNKVIRYLDETNRADQPAKLTDIADIAAT